MRFTYFAILSIGILLALAPGCASLRGPSPEEVIMQKTQAFANDFIACNADKILDYVSETFTNYEVADKATLANHIKEAKESGKVDEFRQMIKDYNGKVDLSNAKVTVDKGKGTAIVYPIEASADVGSVTVELQYIKDPDKVWRISGIDIEGI
ncbi:MAG TPA: hypothetical protein PLI09_15135 [Candidatus Hydrogenedentes bacterium]|nr:hypothetical protein [Candidatus Hydrogenedentota bacterium]